MVTTRLPYLSYIQTSIESYYRYNKEHNLPTSEEMYGQSKRQFTLMTHHQSHNKRVRDQTVHELNGDS